MEIPVAADDPGRDEAGLAPVDCLVFLRARANLPAEAFQEWYVTEFASRLRQVGPALRRHVANLAVAGPAELRPTQGDTDPAARYDVVADLELDDVATFRAAFDGQELATRADVRHAYRVSRTVVIDQEARRLESLPGYKVMREIVFHADMPDTAARRSWTHHGSLARKVHVGVTRYVQHWVEEKLSPNSVPIRGISELYLPSWEALAQRYYDSPRGREEVTHDAGHFIADQLPRIYAREHLLTTG
jgi:hypothetical protein